MKKFRKGVFVVVFSLKPLRYLLLHRKWHWQGWEFPKGGMLAREKIDNAVKREVREETGLKVLSIIPFKNKCTFIYDKKTQQERKARGFNYTLFGCEVKRGKAKIGKREHDGFRWLSYAEALRLLRWPDQKRALRTVDNALKKV